MTIETSANPLPAAPPPCCRHLAKVGFVVFCLYVAAMYVLALDQNFHWGLFPNQAEKEISAKISQLGDTSLPAEKHDAVMKDIVNWNTFAVPALLKAIEQGSPAIREPALKCLQTLSLKFYNVDLTKFGSDPAKLNQWWRDLQAEWAKAEAAAATEKK